MNKNCYYCKEEINKENVEIKDKNWSICKKCWLVEFSEIINLIYN